MKIVRRVTEAEVITEFLKNEFYQKQFDCDRERFEEIVLHPDLTDKAQNAVRRALLYRRRGHMWRELPPDTQWWDVEVEPQDISQIQVFPRAHWRTISNGSFLLSDIVERLRQMPVRGSTGPVISKIHLLRYRLQREAIQSAVLLIGPDQGKPLTILEGNHRLTAAMLISPHWVQTSFRILCGFSPRMEECCWYRTNLPNLWNYFKNRLHNIVDKEADVNRILAEVYGPEPAKVYAEATSSPRAEAK